MDTVRGLLLLLGLAGLLVAGLLFGAAADRFADRFRQVGAALVLALGTLGVLAVAAWRSGAGV